MRTWAPLVAAAFVVAGCYSIDVSIIGCGTVEVGETLQLSMDVETDGDPSCSFSQEPLESDPGAVSWVDDLDLDERTGSWIAAEVGKVAFTATCGGRRVSDVSSSCTVTIVEVGEPPLDLNGDWDFTWTQVTAGGACTETRGQSFDEVITIEHDPDTGEVVLAGFLGREEAVLEGSLDDRDLFFAGTLREDRGVTQSVYELTVETDDDTLSGTETWSWGPDEDDLRCIDIVSELDGSRL